MHSGDALNNVMGREAPYFKGAETYESAQNQDSELYYTVVVNTFQHWCGFHLSSLIDDTTSPVSRGKCEHLTCSYHSYEYFLMGLWHKEFAHLLILTILVPG